MAVAVCSNNDNYLGFVIMGDEADIIFTIDNSSFHLPGKIVAGAFRRSSYVLTSDFNNDHQLNLVLIS